MNRHTDPAMRILGELVAFPTVTTETNLDLIEYAANYLEPYASDMRLTHDGGQPKANLLATIGPIVDGGVILSGHTDVVPAEESDWTGAAFVAERREERIYGRGTADMKGFIACAMAMAPTFVEMPLALPIHIALTYDEEVGCRGAPGLIEDLLAAGPKPSAAIVGEPTGMGIVTAHKGCYEYTTTLTGIEGHGSRPDLGVNAVHHAARFVSRLLELSEEMKTRAPAASPFDPPHTTISAGAIHGGSARNVLAGECVVEWEMRPINTADARFALAEIGSFEEQLRSEMGANTSLETAREGEVDGLEHDPDSAALTLVRDLVGTEETDVVAFGTEAGLYQMAGIPAVVCGPGSIEVAHQPDEYLGLDQFEACLDMMERLGAKLSSA